MNGTWQADSGCLTFKWTGLLEETRYTPTFLQEPSQNADNCAMESVPDFAAHSLLGSGEWFVPWNLRWSTPTRSSF